MNRQKVYSKDGTVVGSFRRLQKKGNFEGYSNFNGYNSVVSRLNAKGMCVKAQLGHMFQLSYPT